MKWGRGLLFLKSWRSGGSGRNRADIDKSCRDFSASKWTRLFDAVKSFSKWLRSEDGEGVVEGVVEGEVQVAAEVDEVEAGVVLVLLVK